MAPLRRHGAFASHSRPTPITTVLAFLIGILVGSYLKVPFIFHFSEEAGDRGALAGSSNMFVRLKSQLNATIAEIKAESMRNTSRLQEEFALDLEQREAEYKAALEEAEKHLEQSKAEMENHKAASKEALDSCRSQKVSLEAEANAAGGIEKQLIGNGMIYNDVGFVDPSPIMNTFFSGLFPITPDRKALFLSTHRSGFKQDAKRYDMEGLQSCKEVDVVFAVPDKCYVVIGNDVGFPSYSVHKFRYQQEDAK